VIGRYAIYGEIAAGGMATVHLGRLLGEAGFSRTVAIKRLHEHFAKDPDFVAMFLDEARLASRVRHPNVVSILDVVTLGREIFLVMDYVQGESLSRLIRAARAGKKQVPPKIALSIMVGALHGLHAAHEAKSENGGLLGIVHRDVSPQNILVDVDGVARVIDFGVAKAAGRLQNTREGTLKGKLQYMPPEQIEGGAVDRRSDIYAASVVLWEVLTGTRLFKSNQEVSVLHEIMTKVVKGDIEPPSQYAPGLPKALDAIVLRGLSAKPEDRFQTAREMAVDIEKALVVASTRVVGEWVESVAGELLQQKLERIAEIESISTLSVRPQFRSSGDDVTAVQTPGVQLQGAPIDPTFTSHSVVSSPSLVSSASYVGPNSQVIPIGGAYPPQMTPAAPQPASGRNAVIIAAGVGGGIVVLGLIGMFLILKGSATAGPPPPASVPIAMTAAPPTVPSEQPPTISIDDLARVTDDDAGADAGSSDDAGAGGKVTTPVGTRVKAPVTAPPATTTSKPPSVSCDPPYTIDATGIKHYKPQCLQ
jgi:serine/threonine-protein kinase